jgi:hypothetical protein
VTLDRTSAEIAFATAILMAVVAFAHPASAHVMGVSRGDYTLDGNRLRVEIVLRADEAAAAVPGLDADGDGRVSRDELDRAGPALQAAFFEPLDVIADAVRCPPAFDESVLEPPEALRLRATYLCPRSPARLHLRFGFLDRLPSAHRHLATIHLPRGEIETLAVFARPDLDVLVSETSSRGFLSLLRGGIEHILTGADHLAFLLALVLGGVGHVRLGSGGAWFSRTLAETSPAETTIRPGPLVGVLTAFTVGHSLSLGMATLGGFAPGARVIEPAVALSVAYVGAENLFARRVAHRWLLTFPFGLVHGFAFAGGLLPLGLPRAQLPAALFAFNLGVEAGQLGVLAVLLPPLAWLRRYGFYPVAARVVSAAVALAGIAWFVQRVT